MTADLTMLVWTVILSFAIPYIYLAARLMTPGGYEWGIGNREKPFTGPMPEWARRCERAEVNLLHNLPGFAALVLMAHVTDTANATTALGAQIFFWARVAHLASYIAGIIYLRTFVFIIAFVGEVMILSQILG